eukprot:TRINITY_DN12934_c0_g1_i1.p1 TRINITY_DN12934_c0_g1~~TRINITY_DN12934_c0_g1_i1.p1  ORF type:complete len:353 (-),score=66.38 TRINITY_DN12934_c0_g1_i1:79-1110(-)
MATTIEKCIIIGSGPSAWTAALYAGRANLHPLVFPGRFSETLLPGGQLMTTTEVENFPGFVHGVTGPTLVSTIRDQALRFDVRIATDNGFETTVTKYGDDDAVFHWQNIDKVDFSRGSPFSVFSDKGEEFKAHTVIIATGASANYLGLPSERQYFNQGVSACAVCDGAAPRFKNAAIAVVGGGDTAVEEATFLTKFAETVYLVHRRDRMRASKIMQQRLLDNPKIKPLWNRVVTEVHGAPGQGVVGISLKSTVDDVAEQVPVKGLFLAIGHTPNVAFLGGQLALKENQYIQLPVPHRTNTSVDGVFAAGDCADDHYKQAITAAGTGCAAALDAEKWLAAHGIE